MSLAAQINAASDDDLKERLTAAAYEAGIFNPEGWVNQNRRTLALAKVGDSGDDTVASVLAYAVASYGGRPGQDSYNKVTDDQLRHAVRVVLATQETKETASEARQGAGHGYASFSLPMSCL